MLYAADYRKIADKKLDGKRGGLCGFAVLGMLILTFLNFISGALNAVEHGWGFALFFWIFSLALRGMIDVGFIKLSLNCIWGREVSTYDGFDFSNGTKSLIVYFIEILWSVLLIVPGVIMHYAYAMTFHIMYDKNSAPGYNRAEDISTLEAMKLSKELMRGNKWRLFCLRFSFIGWYLLGVCSLGIGFIWIIPYQKVAEAAFYESLADKDYERHYLRTKSASEQASVNTDKATNKVKTASPQPQTKQQPKPTVTQTKTTAKTSAPIVAVNTNPGIKKLPPTTTASAKSDVKNTSSTVTKERSSTTINDGENKDIRNEIGNTGKEMRDDFNDWLILEGFFAVVREQLILNGIDDTFNRYEHSAIGTFTCNGNSVAIGYNVSESAISYSIKNRSVVKKDYSGDKDEIYEIVDEILKKAMTVETEPPAPSINLGRVLTAADFENEMTEGTKAYEIYVRNCFRYGWDYSARGRFQKMQPLFSSNVTREGYDAWFVANNNTRTSAAKITGNWYNVIHKNGIEECWRAPYASGMGIRHDMLNDRVTYVKTPNGYVFAGIYVPTGKIEKKIIEGEQFLVKSYVKIEDNYPMNKNKT